MIEQIVKYKKFQTQEEAAAYKNNLRRNGVHAWCTLDRDPETAADLFKYRTIVCWYDYILVDDERDNDGLSLIPSMQVH